MHFCVAIMLCSMQTQLTSVPLKSKCQGQGHLVTFCQWSFGKNIF